MLAGRLRQAPHLIGRSVGRRFKKEGPVQRKWCCAAILLLAFSAAPSVAAEEACFEIYPNGKSGPEGAILLNKCTGQSWLLVGVNTGYGNTSGWYPIPIDLNPESQADEKKGTTAPQPD